MCQRSELGLESHISGPKQIQARATCFPRNWLIVDREKKNEHLTFKKQN